MAYSSIFRLDDKRSKAFHALGLLSLMLLMQNCAAREFRVNWSVPSNNSALSYNQWAEENRFQIGDYLVFNYAAGQDSVLEVTKDAYDNCSTEVPLANFTDGNSVYTFNHSGPFYFISGIKDNCLKLEKLIVVVLANRSNSTSNTTQSTPPSPPPSGSTEIITPGPAPASENSPPAGAEENPAPAPVPPPSAASSTLISVINSIGAFAAASSLLLVF